jgi:hypothetical protein
LKDQSPNGHQNNTPTVLSQPTDTAPDQAKVSPPADKPAPARRPQLQLDDVIAFLSRYLHCTEHQRTLLALWILHTHCPSAAENALPWISAICVCPAVSNGLGLPLPSLLPLLIVSCHLPVAVQSLCFQRRNGVTPSQQRLDQRHLRNLRREVLPLLLLLLVLELEARSQKLVFDFPKY